MFLIFESEVSYVCPKIYHANEEKTRSTKAEKWCHALNAVKVHEGMNKKEI